MNRRPTIQLDTLPAFNSIKVPFRSSCPFPSGMASKSSGVQEAAGTVAMLQFGLREERSSENTVLS